ncbi:amidophosphoribosyltransferase [Candidatus Margulisiibacteriota bacterium]
MCGLYGVYAPDKNVAELTYLGLFALQHRGQESAGISSAKNGKITTYKAMGLVPQVFNQSNLPALNGDMAIGHVRYSTTGSSNLENAQPIEFSVGQDEIATLAHNGNLVNAEQLRNQLSGEGYTFSSTSDSEIISVLFKKYYSDDLEETVHKMMNDLKGAYSVLIMLKDKIIGFRDEFGIRPLCIGKLEGDYVIASESCALETTGAQYLRDVENGEVIIFDKDGSRSRSFFKKNRKALCIFEHIYFARPDSVMQGRTLYKVREKMGQILAREHPVKADIVIAVPDSGIPAAIGYAKESGIPFEEGMIKNRYVGRTFINPDQTIRELGVRIKLNPIKEVLQDKRVIIVDDSIVRGTTSKKIVKLLREAGAREIHMRVSSPPIVSPCFYGIDTATKSELIAANMSIEDIAKHLDVDSLGYLSIKGLIKSTHAKHKEFCLGCFNNDYPVDVPEQLSRLKLLFK